MGLWMLFGSIWMVVFWGFVIALVVWGIRKLTERNTLESVKVCSQDPLEIAKERYARGEISKEEFEQIRRSLRP